MVKKANFRVVPVNKEEPLRLELKHFIDCVQTREIPETDGFEGLRVLEAAEKSLKLKKSIIM